MNLKHLSDKELLVRTDSLAKQERKISAELLWHIREVEDRKTYLDCGVKCNSIFDYIVKVLKFSDSCASSRMHAARLLKFVPEVAEKIENGSLNLATARLTQNVMLAHEKSQGKLSDQQKACIIEKIENQPKRSVEKILMQELPEAAKQIELKAKETTRPLTDGKALMKVVIDDETAQLLKRAQEILSHACKGNGDIIKRALQELVAKIEPAKEMPERKTTPSNVVKTKPGVRTKVSASTKRKLYQRDQSSCQELDPVTGEKCGCKKYLNIDHIIPVALGGTNDLDNLRLLCRTHNILAAEKIFGKTHMAKFTNAQINSVEEINTP